VDETQCRNSGGEVTWQTGKETGDNIKMMLGRWVVSETDSGMLLVAGLNIPVLAIRQQACYTCVIKDY
jgi:hypothetical protein